MRGSCKNCIYMCDKYEDNQGCRYKYVENEREYYWRENHDHLLIEYQDLYNDMEEWWEEQTQY